MKQSIIKTTIELYYDTEQQQHRMNINGNYDTGLLDDDGYPQITDDAIKTAFFQLALHWENKRVYGFIIDNLEKRRKEKVED